MRFFKWILWTAAILCAVGSFAPLNGQVTHGTDEPARGGRKASDFLALNESAADSVSGTFSMSSSSAEAMVLDPRVPEDGCLTGEVIAVPTRPVWDNGAATTQCGILESDTGWQYQPMGGGVSQKFMVSSLRYGLTPRLDLRWGLVNHIYQSGGAAPAVQGAGDQTVGLRYRFYEQNRRIPAMAVAYAVKLPTANAAKGIGTGYVDHQIFSIVSEDFGKTHMDWNMGGTLAGSARGIDGGLLSGMDLARPLTARLTGVLESYGGTQPETRQRLSSALGGVSYNLRPYLVLDAAYCYTFTAATPNAQVLFGITYARRPNFNPVAKASWLGRALGR